jgi:type IV pilus assembly protein PilC
MAVFKFEAMNAQGQSVKDEVEAANSEEAIQKIRARNLFPTNVTEKKAAAKKKPGTPGAGPRKKTMALGGVSGKQLTTFTRQLSTLQDAGLPVVRSIKILEGQMKPGMLKNVLIDVADDIEGGSTFSEALAKHPRVYDKLYVNMIRAGEVGGVLAEILQRLADFREKAQKLKKMIIGAMIYPAVVVCVAGGILAAIMIFIVPKFKKMFDELNIELPFLTQVLLDVSHFLQYRAYWIPIYIFAAFAALKVIGATKGGRYAIDKVKLKVPVFGVIINKSTISRFARTLGTLVSSGVPILEALNIVKETTGNAVVSRAISNVHDSIREGESIAEPLQQSKVCDDMVVNMIQVGEETGDLDKMLLKVADTYDDDVDTAVGSMTSLIEPIMIVGLGAAVGFIVIALFMPLIKLMGSMGS